MSEAFVTTVEGRVVPLIEIVPAGWAAECQAHALSMSDRFRSPIGPQTYTDFATNSTPAAVDFALGGSFVVVGGGSGIIGLGSTASVETAFPIGVSGSNNAPIRSMLSMWAVYSRADFQVLTPTSGNRQFLVGCASSSIQCYLGWAPEISTTKLCIWTEGSNTVSVNLGPTTVTNFAPSVVTSTCRTDWALVHDGWTCRAFMRPLGKDWSLIGELMNVSNLVDQPAWVQVGVKSSVGSEFVIYDKAASFTTLTT